MQPLEHGAHAGLADARPDRLSELVALFEREGVVMHGLMIGAAARGRLMQVKPVPGGSATMAP